MYLIQIIYRIVVFFGEYIKMDAKRYVFDLLEYTILFVVEVWLSKFAVGLMYSHSFLSFLGAVGICVVIPMGINVTLFYKSSRFKSLTQIFSTVNKKKIIL